MALKIGITGGIATGKTTVTTFLRKLNYEVIDADIIAKDIMSNNQDVLANIMDNFPEAIDSKSKVINRKILADIIFHNPMQRQLLNSIVHPLVKQNIIEKISLSRENIIFVDVPLLYETSFDDLFDYVIVIYTDSQTQLERLRSRDNISIDYAKTKISAQMSLEDKKKKADFIIDNSGDVESTKKQMLEIIDIISKKG